ncbi:TetR/AcrR family transcriptional regulator [Skermania piniformis]|uniref:TetR/AcrR family transcriptional regulator n=1 Tax=Skermania pinensis TaxID=39122 RepID=A0ABX8S573_9ACTN|nr:TetR/AcrR family transcriptional regulator [Skermania piniformis]QXQ12999.1 TetR/AcrR family transcriptional regulator [Skermania piniformis]
MSTRAPRRTQHERRVATRARILDCAVACLLERGYAATTISEVQERAGLARGTVQHHFPSKQDLVVDATAHVVEARLARFEHEARLVPPDRRPFEAFVDLAWRDLNSPAFFAALELWVAARTDTQLRDRLVAEERRLFERMRSVYASVLGDPYATDPRTPTVVEFTIDVLTGLSMTTMLTGNLGEREAALRRWTYAVALMYGEIAPDDLLAGPRISTSAG